VLTMKKIAFVGIGVMGKPMATHLLKAGYPVSVFNRTQAKSLELESIGATISKTMDKVAADADIVFTMLSDEHAVREVVLGEQGVASGAKPGKTLFINTSTVSPESNIALGKELQALGFRFMDAPVTGSGLQAIAKTIVFIASGDKESFEEALPVFRAMGKDAYFAGSDIGAASYAKLCSNAMMSVHMAAFSEAVVLATKSGVNPEMFVKFCAGGGSQSAIADKKIPKIVNRDFSPAFRAQLMHKDTLLARALANRMKVPMPMLSLASELFMAACQGGYGDEDICALVKLYENWAGQEVRVADESD
jgi:3-hydroxyisobutyrate dehydrogenase-like beta-hydroxyacid dehydrogenase